VKKYAGLDFSQVVKEYSDDITKICVLKLNNIEDAKDCFQNVFLKLHISKTSFSDISHLRAWLIRVACNECNDFNRSYWRKNVVFESSPNIYKAFTDDFECIETIELIRSLPQKYREIIFLYYFEEYTTSEISEILKININTVKSRLQRARTKIELELKGNYYEKKN